MYLNLLSDLRSWRDDQIWFGQRIYLSESFGNVSQACVPPFAGERRTGVLHNVIWTLPRCRLGWPALVHTARLSFSHRSIPSFVCRSPWVSRGYCSILINSAR